MLTAGLGLLGLAVAHLLGTGIGVIAAQLLTRRIMSWRPALRIPDVARMLVAAFPVGAAAALSLLMFRVDVVLLEALRGPESVAAFSAAHRLYEAAVLLPAAVMAGTFPALARSMADLVAFRQRIREVAVLLATYGVAATLAGWLLAPIVVPLIFGSSYAGSGQLLQVMVLAVPFLALNALLTQALIAVGRAWREAAAVALALAVAVAVNLALIPSLGAIGAAGAVVAGEAALLLACLIALAGLRPYGNNSSASR
ncbi:MAG: polysaccharide biosynthesis C-terminal domain-containing protein [Chloroflexi bacterium]|nr:polysaccharide biosynthesis C-terminal domain-containing protein [Chloroflexota bacterium]